MLERLLALVAGTALLTAGCIGSDATGDTPSATGPEANALETNASATPPLASEGLPAPVEPVVVPLAWDGSMATHATLCEWQNVGECVTVPPGTELDNTLMPPLPGPPVAGTLTLTWDATSPLTEELVLVVMAMVETEDGMEHPLFVASQNTSPIELSFADAVVPPEAMVHLWVGVPSLLPDPFWAAATTEQPFHLEGTFTVLPVDGAMGAEHGGH